uniref:WSC domain-containing protein n=1 Tax=Panagrolaimus davidi TaxID=227884 RepID=A0A914QI69_9BILA
MVKPGPLDVVLNNANELAFEVCEQNCFAPFLVCFEGAFDGSYSTAFCDSKCGFYVDSNENDITFMNPFTEAKKGRRKRNCTEMVMKNGITSQFAIDYRSCLPKVENGIKNAHVKVETTTAPPPTTTTLGPLNQTSSGKNAASTDEPGSFFADYWWIFLILALILIAIGIGVGVYCYLRCKKKAQKPVPVRRRRLQGSKSPVVLQPSTETQNVIIE